MDIRHEVPLAPLSSFGIGGPAKTIICAHGADELVNAIDYANEHSLPFRVFAGGTNILFPDGGIDDLLIHITDKTSDVDIKTSDVDSHQTPAGYTFYAGLPLMEVINFAIERGLKGLETLSGIPGSLGGAVFGNAGAYGREIGEIVDSVELYDGVDRFWISQSECHFSYRSSIFKSSPNSLNSLNSPNYPVILNIKLRFPEKAPSVDLQKISSRIVKTRAQKYSPNLKCPGSFFKNLRAADLTETQLARLDPNKIVYDKVPAGYLLEEVGAKGMRLGGIEIADFHANLLINTDSGTAAQVKELAADLKSRVQKKFGITLEEEIRYF